MASEGFLIGPGVRDALRATIARVHEMPYGKEPTRIQTRFEDIPTQSPVFRIATFTGTWNINTDKTVSLVNSGNTNDSRVARNLFASISASTNSTNASHCAIARDGTAWYLIAAGCP